MLWRTTKRCFVVLLSEDLDGLMHGVFECI